MSLEFTTNPEQTLIFRGADVVADIIDGKCKMRPEFRKYAIGAGKFWKAFTYKPKSETLHVPSPADTVTESGFVVAGDVPAARRSVVEGVVPVFNVGPSPKSTVTERGFVADDSAEIDANIPPMPEMDPAMGTKTPAVVEWYKRYKPEQWAKMHEGWINR